MKNKKTDAIWCQSAFYPPHLHFQIIKDIADYKGDYPGVCSMQSLAFYLSNSPDPNLLLKID